MKRWAIGIIGAGLLAGCAATPRETGPATTRASVPVVADDTVDYLAAYEKAASAGVTETNNAGVLITRLVGKKRDGVGEFENWNAYGKRMKWDEGVEAEEWKKVNHEKVESRIDRTEREPWKAEEFPLLAKWLASQEKALALLTEASRRERYYVPLEADPSAPAPWGRPRPALPMYLWKIRMLSNGLMMRAMLHAGSGDAEGALEDLRSVRRLGRLMGQEPALISQLVACDIERMSWRAMETLVQQDMVTAAQRAILVKEARETEEFRLSPAAIDVGERFFQLDGVMSATHGDAEQAVSEVSGFAWLYLVNASQRPKLALGDLATTDWSLVTARINHEMDELKVIAADRDEVREVQRVTEFVSSHKAWNESGMVNDLSAPNDEAANKKQQEILEAYLRRKVNESRAAFSERIAVLFSGDHSILTPYFALALRPCAIQRQLQIVLALGSFREAKGSYPVTLAELAPGYLERVPRDPLSGAAMVYRREGGGYVLYGVGLNGKDDGGKEDDLVSKVDK